MLNEFDERLIKREAKMNFLNGKFPRAILTLALISVGVPARTAPVSCGNNGAYIRLADGRYAVWDAWCKSSVQVWIGDAATAGAWCANAAADSGC